MHYGGCCGQPPAPPSLLAAVSSFNEAADEALVEEVERNANKLDELARGKSR
jgi:hypothetical protein